MRLRVTLLSLLTGAFLAGCGGGGPTDTATGIGSATSSMATQITGPRRISVYGDSVAKGIYAQTGFSSYTHAVPPPSDYVTMDLTPLNSPTTRIREAAGLARLSDTEEAIGNVTIGGAALNDLLVLRSGSFTATLDTMLKTDTSNVIVVRLGGNDAFLAVSNYDGSMEENFSATMKARTRSVIDIVRQNNKIPVIVGVPPMNPAMTKYYYAIDPQNAVANRIIDNRAAMTNIANVAIKDAAAEKGALFVDLRDGSVPPATDPNYSNDGIHANPEASHAMSFQIGSQVMASFAQPQDWPVTSVATSTQIWPNTNLMDLNLAVGWSSAYSPTPNHLEHLAYWFGGFHPVNYVKLYPRVVNGKSLGFPTSFNVYWSNGSAWNMVKSYTNFPSPTKAAYVVLPLPSAVSADGILVVATTLGSDDYSGYYFQMQEVGAGYDSSRP